MSQLTRQREKKREKKGEREREVYLLADVIDCEQSMMNKEIMTDISNNQGTRIRMWPAS